MGNLVSLYRSLPGLILLIAGGLLLGGCVQGSTKVETKRFPLTVVAASSMGNDASAPLPKMVQELFLPMKTQECPGVAFVPDKPKVVRVDSQPPTRRSFKPEGGLTAAVQQFFQSTTYESLQKGREDYFSDQTVGETLSAPTSEASSVKQNIKNFLKESSYQRTLFLNESLTESEGEVRLIGTEFLAGNSPQIIREKIARDLCQRRDASSFGSYAVVVGYQAESGNQPERTEAPSSGRETSRDEAYQQFIEWQESSKHTNQQISDRLAKLEEAYPHDYRFTFERARLSVYGYESHHEAFKRLRRATEKAIENDKARELLETLNHRKEDEGNPVWKLAHGHDEKWNPIIEALQERSTHHLESHREH